MYFFFATRQETTHQHNIDTTSTTAESRWCNSREQVVWQLHDRCAGTRRKTVSRGWPGPRQTSPRHDPGAAGHPDGQRTTGGATSGATRPPGCRHGCSDTRHKAWQPQGKSQLGQKGRKDRSAGPRVRHRHRAPSHIATAYHRRASAPPRHRISSGRQHMTGSPLAGSHSREKLVPNR